MNSASLIVARYCLTHPDFWRVFAKDVMPFDEFVRWVHEEFGVCPSQRTLIEARSLLVSLAQENQP